MAPIPNVFKNLQAKNPNNNPEIVNVNVNVKNIGWLLNKCKNNGSIKSVRITPNIKPILNTP